MSEFTSAESKTLVDFRNTNVYNRCHAGLGLQPESKHFGSIYKIEPAAKKANY